MKGLFALLIILLMVNVIVSAEMDGGDVDQPADGDLDAIDQSSDTSETSAGFESTNGEITTVDESGLPIGIQNLRVLHIGDSHTAGAYGQELDRLLRTKFSVVTTAGVCGAKAQYYLDGTENKCSNNPEEKCCGNFYATNNIKETPSKSGYQIGKLIDTLNETSFPPDIFIISLGTNYKNDNFDGEDILVLINQTGAKKCFFIGAPPSTNDNVNPDLINKKLIQVIGNECKFINPYHNISISDLTGSSDGIHYPHNGGVKWAQAVFIEIVGETSGITPTIPEGGIEDISSSDNIDLTTSSTTTQSTCSGYRCKEIDEVWQALTGDKGSSLITTHKKQFWDKKNGWKTFDELYSKPSTINQNEFSGDASTNKLVNAIIKFESGGKADLISSTGCAGLMQICMGSASISFIRVQCKQDATIGPRWCNYQKCTQGSNFCETCDQNTEPCVPDNRFDRNANIQAGMYILEQKMKSVQGCNSGPDRIKCQIAAYNIGEGVIISAITETGIQNPTWQQVSDKFTIDLLRQLSVYSKWTDSEITTKISNVKAYVNNVYTEYSK